MTGPELIEAAFGGVTNLWPLGRKYRGTFTYRMALKRISRSVPLLGGEYLSPTDRLFFFWGLIPRKRRLQQSQGLCFVAKHHCQLSVSHIITANLARKWLLNVNLKGCKESNGTQSIAAGEDLNEHNLDGGKQIPRRLSPLSTDFGVIRKLWRRCPGMETIPRNCNKHKTV